ncbi:ATP-dependent metallopeptidase FtsH/Yme1/Tma family protein [Alkaliphilus hydrothermalis]|uniref:ATP-dependent zinc metalloprotease FtsH n=1 Tax=Alkaliphilus hydrothermalis TaxID=1482730 RepID=A0ABS2NPM9_9FIRM|nr:ATP-dependent metallopeptidase FtsH/Yme1/Tma family protein [Alkaliphilus hydrothermalis]MBM7614876.1 cell division protease FtsH [Alkaliphilus hydrothermalis]
MFKSIKSKKHRMLAVGTLLIVMVLAVSLGIYKEYYREEVGELSYQSFLAKMEAGEVKEVYLSEGAELKGKLTSGAAFITDNPRTDSLKEMLLMKGVKVVEVNEQFSIGQLITFIVVMVGFFGFAIFMSKNNSRQASKEYDKMSSVDYATEKKSQINFRSVAGNEEAKGSLMEMVDFLKNPDKYSRYGAKMPRGVILYGPPGTGKTLMAKALASEAGVDFMAVSGSDFVQIYAGVGAARIRSLFKSAAEKGKCVIFIDEIDAIGKKRDRGGLGGSDESDRTLNALLTEMSGFKGNEGIVVLAATNRLDTLDEALLRPGRFDRQIEVGLPDVKARMEILSLYTQNRPIAEDLNIAALAQQTVYFSGAKLENLMNEAAIYAARENAEAITEKHVDRAFYTVVAGEEKKDRSNIPQIDRKITAYHEAGHAAITKLLCPKNRVTKVTIIPSTKGAGGFSMNIPPDKMYHTKRDMLNNIKIALAGRIAEEVTFGEDNITTGASNDIQRATEILSSMIKRFGMSNKLGMINYDILLGQQGVNQNLVEVINKEMERLYDETKAIIQENLPLVEAIAEGLLAKETLKEDEIDELCKNYKNEEAGIMH